MKEIKNPFDFYPNWYDKQDNNKEINFHQLFFVYQHINKEWYFDTPALQPHTILNGKINR
jgi:hypothetical protein